MKILYLISSLDIGGAEILLRETTAYLVEWNEIQVIYFRGDGILVRDFDPAVKITKASLGWKGFRKINGMVERLAPDVIHTHLLPADILLLFLRRSRKIRYFTTIHNTGKGNAVRDWVANRIYKRIERRFAGRHKFVLISNAVRDHVQSKAGIGKGNCALIHNGVRIPENIERKPGKEKLRLLFVGRLVRQKNPFQVLEICRRLHGKGISFSVTVVGDGCLRNRLIRKCRAEGLDQLISFVGGKVHVPDYYLDADALLVTSVVEGFGLVAVEAMSYEVCVLARSVGGLAEIIEDGINGYLCSRVDNFVERLVVLESDPKTRVAVARRSRISAARKFDLRDKSRQLQSLYAG